MSFIVGHFSCFHFFTIINKRQDFLEREIVGMLFHVSVYLFVLKDLEQMD